MHDSHLDAWAAGFIDGDGCILLATVRQHGYRTRRLSVQADQVGDECPEPLTLLREIFGGSLFRVPRSDIRRAHWRWRVVGPHAENVLRRIAPYAVMKREQVRIAIEARERAMGKDSIALADEYEARLRALKRGTSVAVELAAINAHLASVESEHGERWAMQREDQRYASLARYHNRSTVQA